MAKKRERGVRRPEEGGLVPRGTGGPLPSSPLGATMSRSAAREGAAPKRSGFGLESGIQPTPSLASSDGREPDPSKPDAMLPGPSAVKRLEGRPR